MEPSKELPPVREGIVRPPSEGVSENLPANPEISGNTVNTPPVTSQHGQLPAQPVVNIPDDSTPQDSAAQSSMPALSDDALIADDADLIEKEWVNKAKEIVERTKDDPYSQNDQMAKVKADYVKKRYNKDLKVDNK